MCNIKGHIVKFCRSPKKAEWLKERQRRDDDRKRSRRDDSDEESDRGRSQSRNRFERSNSRGRSPSAGRSQKYRSRPSDRDRSVSRERSNSVERDNSSGRRKQLKASDDPWSSVKGRRRDSDSEESNMVFYEEWEGETKIHIANMTVFRNEDKDEWVCVDSGSNQIVLKSSAGLEDFIAAVNAYLKTAQAGAELSIAGRGRIGKARVLHVPDASANLMSTNAMTLCGVNVFFGADNPEDPTTV